MPKTIPAIMVVSSFGLTGLLIVTAGAREQPLDWQTAPPVHVLSFLVLGSEKDARTKEVSCTSSY